MGLPFGSVKLCRCNLGMSVVTGASTGHLCLDRERAEVVLSRAPCSLPIMARQAGGSKRTTAQRSAPCDVWQSEQRVEYAGWVMWRGQASDGGGGGKSGSGSGSSSGSGSGSGLFAGMYCVSKGGGASTGEPVHVTRSMGRMQEGGRSVDDMLGVCKYTSTYVGE